MGDFNTKIGNQKETGEDKLGTFEPGIKKCMWPDTS